MKKFLTVLLVIAVMFTFSFGSAFAAGVTNNSDANMIKQAADYVKAGQVVIDVGINVNAEGKLCGDVDYAAVEPIVDAITPVPGGVGSVTTSVLVGHVVEAAMRKVNA